MVHPNIVRTQDVEARSYEHGDMRGERRRLAAAAGARRVGLSRYRVAAGARMMPSTSTPTRRRSSS